MYELLQQEVARLRIEVYDWIEERDEHMIQ
jgi:hypothetical protein